MAHSVISSPTLTGTTNVNVAERECVQCDVPPQEAVSESGLSGQLGQTHDTGQDAANEARYLAERIESQETNSCKQGRFTRLAMAISALLGKKDRERFSRLDEEEPLSLARIHAETTNLCKDKIKNLTGNGRVRRKSINVTYPVCMSPGICADNEADPPLLSKKSQEYLPTTAEIQDSCSAFGSLSRSFNSALEKLNLLDTGHHNGSSRNVVEVTRLNLQSLRPLTMMQCPHRCLESSQLRSDLYADDVKHIPDCLFAQLPSHRGAVHEAVACQSGVARTVSEIHAGDRGCEYGSHGPNLMVQQPSLVVEASSAVQPRSPFSDACNDGGHVDAKKAEHATVVSGLQMHPNTSEFSSAPASAPESLRQTSPTMLSQTPKTMVCSSTKRLDQDDAQTARSSTSKYGRALKEAKGAANKFLGLNKGRKY